MSQFQAPKLGCRSIGKPEAGCCWLLAAWQTSRSAILVRRIKTLNPAHKGELPELSCVEGAACEPSWVKMN
eukprot:SAG25_NODE_413_length_8292_cov_7.450629_7_plen_71_part_00